MKCISLIVINFQINGDLNLIPNSKESRISLSISQHGIKIVNENGVVSSFIT